MVVENTDPNANGTEKGFGGIFGIIVLVIILIIGGWWLLSSRSSAPASGNSIVLENQFEIENATSGTPGAVQNSENVTITYTDQGFSPKLLTVSKGTAVEFVNQSGRPMWVASNEHPTHTIYGGTSRTQHCPDTAGTSFDQCSTGNSFIFTFDRTGSWNYHNHTAASDGGIIVVE